VIRFSAFLVVVAVGLLIAGVVTSKLLLVYVAIGVSGVALLALGVGAAVNWRELTGERGTAEPTAAEPTTAEPSLPEPAPVPPEPVPAVPAVAAASAPAAPAPAAFTPRRQTPAPGVWEWRDDSIPAPSPPAPDQASGPGWPPAPGQASGPGPATHAPPWATQAAAAAEALAPPPAQEQPPASARDEAKPAAAASEPEPDSVADPAAEPEVTLVPGTTPADVSVPAAAESKQAEQAEQDQKLREAGPVGPDPSMEVTVVPGVPRYHNARCILIRFMGDSDLDKMTLAAARDVGCTPCRACLPDQPEKSPE